MDEIHESDLDRVLDAVPKTENAADGFQDVGAKAFARAINRYTYCIEKNLGRGQDFPTVI